VGYGGGRHWKSRLRESLVLRLADRVTAPSVPMLSLLREFGITAQRIPFGVDLTAWPPLAPRLRQSRVARLIHVGSLNAVKDQATLLHALAALAAGGVAFQMDIVGEDTLGGTVQALAARLGLQQQVRFLGFHTQRTLRGVMAKADLLVHASRHEAGPIVLLEAAVLGIPAVGTAVGHFVEWSPGAARVVAPGDAAGLAEAMAALLADESLRLQLAWAAQRRAMREDADNTARAFEALYLSVGSHGGSYAAGDASPRGRA